MKSFRYRKYYANDIRQFADDAYIYWYYIHHLLQASRTAEAISVLKDFVWLENCIKSTGPVHVISLFNSVIKEAEITSKVSDHTQVLIGSCLIIEDFFGAILVETSNFNAYFWLLRQFFTIPFSINITVKDSQVMVALLGKHIWPDKLIIFSNYVLIIDD